MKQKLNLKLFFKLLSPYIIIFLVTLVSNEVIIKTKVICFDIGADRNIIDNCSFEARIGLSLYVMFVTVSGHFLLGANMIFKYSNLARRKLLLFIDFVLFISVNFLTINWNLFQEEQKSPSLVFRLVLGVIINSIIFVIICKFIGHKSPYKLMKNYLYFEFLMWFIPAILLMSNTIIYNLFDQHFSSEMSLFLTNSINVILEFLLNEIMISKILQKNQFIETVDLIPGTFILTGYLDGVFLGGLLPQEISSIYFWVNLFLYFGGNFMSLTGLKKIILKPLKTYFKKEKENFSDEQTLFLIENGSKFFSIFPMFITFILISMKKPYFYGSILYDYEKYDWKNSTEDYNSINIDTMISLKKFLIFFLFWLLFVFTGVFFQKNFVFFKIDAEYFLKNIFYTIKNCTMFTLALEYSFKTANVIQNDLFEEIFGPYIDLFNKFQN